MGVLNPPKNSKISECGSERGCVSFVFQSKKKLILLNLVIFHFYIAFSFSESTFSKYHLPVFLDYARQHKYNLLAPIARVFRDFYLNFVFIRFKLFFKLV